MLMTETGDLPEFGFKSHVPLTSGFVERTEIDMKLGTAQKSTTPAPIRDGVS
jgi:hypothetical protein